MNLGRKFFLFVVALLQFFSPAHAQAPRVKAEVDSATFMIGRQVRFSLKAESRADRAIVWPRIGDTLTGGMEVIRELKTDTVFSEDKSKVAFTRNYLITSFDSGFYRIPSFALGFTDGKDTERVFTEPLFVSVSKPPVDTTADIRDIKGPSEVPYHWTEFIPHILTGLGVIALVALLTFFVMRRLRRKKEEPVQPETVPELPIHIQALNRLREIRERRLWQSGKVKEYYTEITDVLRFYIKGRYQIDAAEMVSEDIVKSLKFRGLSPRHYQMLDALLREADLVKFAKAFPDAAQNEEALRTAIAWVEQTAGEVPVSDKEEGGAGHD